MIVNAIQCHQCGDIIFSRARHDFRGCTCGTVAIDGGFDYTKTTYNPEVVKDGVKLFKLEIEQTKPQLWDDWNSGNNQYGLIKMIDENKT